MVGRIYKITNKINGKIYIGLTTTTLKQRWRGHLNSAKTSKLHLYSSMRKYGVENFSIEEIDTADTIEKLGELERFYIKKYNSTNWDIGYNISHGGERQQLDGNPRARLTVTDVEEIRKLYGERAFKVSEVWNLYKDKISYSAFEKIWEGITWKSVMPEVYSVENKKWHIDNDKKNPGEKNGNAIYTDEEVMKIRQYYVTHSLKECFEKFGKKSESKKSFRSLIDRSYLYLPIFKKRFNKWVNPIDGKEHKLRNPNTIEYSINGDDLYITIYDDFHEKSKTIVTDSKFYEEISKYKWHFTDNTVISDTKGKTFSINKIILKNLKEKERVYHIDGDNLNYREENLTTNRFLKIFKDISNEEFLNDYENLSLRKLAKKYKTTKETIKEYYVKIFTDRSCI